MPSILTHPVVPLALAVGLGPGFVSRRLLVAGMLASIVPDLDVAAFSFGIPYESPWGHRGFTHSVAFSLALALSGTGLSRTFGATPFRSFWFLFTCTLSHGLLDAFTNGGLGIAFLWPYSAERFFAPLQVIEVSPIGVSGFLSSRGAKVLWSEMLWVWLPLLGTALTLFWTRRYLSGIAQRRREG